jgi:two-component system, cell cycle sensor histidine kinase and response regulator CckA
VVFKKSPAVNWDQTLLAMESGACALAPTIVATPERGRIAFFTPPYTNAPLVIIGAKSLKAGITLKDFSGRRVAVVAGSAAEKYVRSRVDDRTEIAAFPNMTQAIHATSFGKVDAWVDGVGPASYYIRKEGITNLQVVGNTDFSYALSIGVSRKYPLLFSAVQKALADIAPTELEDVQKRWISLEMRSGMSPETKRILVLTAIFTALLLLGLAIISYLLKRSLNEKVANLRAAQQKILEQSELLLLAADATQAGVWDYRPAKSEIYLSGQWFTMLGYPPKGKTISMPEFQSYVHPEDNAAGERIFNCYIQGGGQGQFGIEFRLRRADGIWCWVLSRGRAVEWDEKGIPSRIIGLNVSIQTIKETQEKMEQSEARFRTLFMNAPIPLAHLHMSGKTIALNDSFVKTIGYTLEDIPHIDHWWPLAYPDPDLRNEVMSSWQAAVDRAMINGSSVEQGEYLVTCKDGAMLTMIAGANMLGDSMLISFFDITERKRDEAARLESMELMRATFNATTDGILVVNKDRKITQVNRQFYKMWDIPPDLQKTDDDATLLAFIQDQLIDPVGFQNKIDALYQSRLQDMDEIHFKDGRVFERSSAPIVVNENETGRVWDFRDISERKRTEAEREKLQEQLLQSQKLEAIGTLAGGVAHDFNNMLGAIIGYAELTMTEMETANPFRNKISRIIDAAQRSAGLTRQLLAFARKQTVTPVMMDLNESIEGTLKMLRRLIGENISLGWMPSSGSCMIKMDPSQFDQILFNLCVNARDAIGGVGTITIETNTVSIDETFCASHVEFVPGEYVVLAVSDDGCGMDKETMKHIFEPFFTTKGIGEGTGMGLATVYGIVKQNDGMIDVYSEPNQGTTFKIYLPSHAPEAVTAEQERLEEIPRSRGETVLIVEDDPTLLEMSGMMLRHLGYSVVQAATPIEAIRITEDGNQEIHLFITDVVMPEMNGRELANRLHEIRPTVKSLFMSGYTADAIAHQGVLDKDIKLIQKPFTLKNLAVEIREVLDGNRKCKD